MSNIADTAAGALPTTFRTLTLMNLFAKVRFKLSSSDLGIHSLSGCSGFNAREPICWRVPLQSSFECSRTRAANTSQGPRSLKILGALTDALDDLGDVAHVDGLVRPVGVSILHMDCDNQRRPAATSGCLTG